MIKFQEVAHHYIGCEVKADSFSGKLIGIVNNNGILVKHIDGGEFVYTEVTPILKSIEDMTDEEFDANYLKFEELEKECVERNDSLKCMSAMFHQMCKDGYDLFGLIESNQAVKK